MQPQSWLKKRQISTSQKFLLLLELSSSSTAHISWNSNSAMLWLGKKSVVQPFEDVFPTSCITYGQSFQVWKVKPMRRCLKPAFSVMLSRGRPCWFQEEVLWAGHTGCLHNVWQLHCWASAAHPSSCLHRQHCFWSAVPACPVYMEFASDNYRNLPLLKEQESRSEREREGGRKRKRECPGNKSCPSTVVCVYIYIYIYIYIYMNK